MKLVDYANSRENVVLFIVSIGNPSGWSEIVHPDWDNTVDLTLEGETDETGTWEWDGKGNPVDMNRNTITRIQAFINEEEYNVHRNA